ncbi:MAG: sensor histidine kinase [Desulfomonilia bacterium]
MSIYWLGESPPHLDSEITQIRSISEIDEIGLLFIQEGHIRRWKNIRCHRAYVVSDAIPRGPLPERVSGVIPNNPAVIEAISSLYSEMKESFDIGDRLIRSVTEKDLTIKEKQRMLLRDSKRHRAIIRNATDLIFVLGPTGRIMFCNETLEHYLGESGQSLVGRSFIDSVSEHDRKNLTQMLRKGFHRGVPSRCEVKLILSCGRIGTFSLMSTPLSEDDHIYALSIIGRDITDLRAMQYRLSIQANDLTQMINGLSHELRNPLTVIGAYIHRLEKGQIDNDDQKRRQALSGIYSSIRRIEDMIERIERYESLVTMEQFFTDVDMEHLVRETLAGFRASVPVHVVTTGGVRAFTDEDHVRCALLRILENAIDSESEEILVDISEERGYACISVRDFGPGICGDIQTLFAPFYSADPMKIGLGLTEARIAMVKIGGEIDVIPQANPGAVFTLKILQDRRSKVRTGEDRPNLTARAS